MTVGKICQHDVDVASPDDTARSAVQMMAKRKVGTLVVVDGQRKPIGLVTDRDLALRVLGGDRDPASTSVGDVMTHEPTVVSESTAIEEALKTMRLLGVRRLPVVGSDGRLSGIVSVDDFLKLLMTEFGDLGAILDKETPHSGALA